MKRQKKPAPSLVGARLVRSAGQNSNTFTFYKDNKHDQAFTLPFQEVKAKYIAFLKARKIKWQAAYNKSQQTVSMYVTAFVTSQDGLRSSITVEDHTKLEKLLLDVKP
jgi:hypothetical protein